MFFCSRLIVLLSLVLVVACGDDARRMRDAFMVPDGGVQDAPADVSSNDAGDGAVADAGAKDLPDAVRTSNGVLTPYPDINYVNLDSDFRLVSANFVIMPSDDPRGNLVEVFVEVDNLRGTESCNFLPDFEFNGVDLLGTVEAPPHFPEFGSTVPTSCIPAGGRGVLRGLARGIDPNDGGSLTVDMNPADFQRYNRAAIEPSRTEDIVEEEGIFRLEGTMTPHIALRNYSLRVYPLDERGVIVDELLAFPGELESLPAGVAVPFSTGGVGCPFETAHAFQGWIQESSTTSSVVGETEWHRRIAMRRQMRSQRL